MDLQVLPQLLVLTITAFSLAFLALWLLARLNSRAHDKKPGSLPVARSSIAFLFDGEDLVNATGPAQQMLSNEPDAQTDWAQLSSGLGDQYPDLHDEVQALAERVEITLAARDDGTHLTASRQDGLMRISITEKTLHPDNIALARSRFDAMEAEIKTLRATAESAPFLVWRQNAQGTITWANNTYLALSHAGNSSAEVAAWPPTRLFELTNASQPAPTNASQRLTTHIPGEAEPRWFECFETPLGEESLYTAVTADKVVKAEVALRDFVQTLTKTFAHLTIGLAIFDKQRRLALFNPALSDLTSLPASFLSGRPTFQAVLDRLREKKMIPEPKDYKTWRRQLYELEIAAVNGTYEETWSLSNGQTFRVTGRPHPDGAVAFLFEDISAEISLTRRFRAELKNGQAVLDTLHEAIAVFAPSGTLLLSNAAYTRLWDLDPSTIVGEYGFVDATRAWAEKCIPSPVWGDAREFAGTLSERAEWLADVQMQDGQKLRCRFTPVSGGATLAGFSRTGLVPAALAPNGNTALTTAVETVTA